MTDETQREMERLRRVIDDIRSENARIHTEAAQWQTRYWRLVGWVDSLVGLRDAIPKLESVLGTIRGINNLPRPPEPGQEKDG